MEKIIEKLKKFMQVLKKFFMSKRFVYGFSSVATIIVVIAMLLGVNLLVDRLDIKVDLTKNKVYSISKQSKDYLKTINDKINIMVFMDAQTLASGNEGIAQIKDTLDEYKKYGKSIDVQYIDATKNPGICSKYMYEGNVVQNYMIVVESGKRYKVINTGDFYTPGGTQSIVSNVEQNITSAINYVIVGKELFAYFTTGHGEDSIENISSIRYLLNGLDYTIKDVNLIQSQGVPSDTSILFLLSPKKDIGTNEKDKLNKYLNEGGRMVVFLEPGNVTFSQLGEVLKNFNVTPVNDIVFEEDSSMYIYGQKFSIKPKIENTPITSDIFSKNYNIVTVATRSFDVSRGSVPGITTYILAESSANSWGKVDLKDPKYIKQAGDVSGPLPLIVAMQKEPSDPKTQQNARIVVFGATKFMDQAIIQQYGAGGNLDLFSGVLRWLSEGRSVISINTKSIDIDAFSPTSTQAIIILVVVAAIPIISLITGIVVWSKRKYL